MAEYYNIQYTAQFVVDLKAHNKRHIISRLSKDLYIKICCCCFLKKDLYIMNVQHGSILCSYSNLSCEHDAIPKFNTEIGLWQNYKAMLSSTHTSWTSIGYSPSEHLEHWRFASIEDQCLWKHQGHKSVTVLAQHGWKLYDLWTNPIGYCWAFTMAKLPCFY